MRVNRPSRGQHWQSLAFLLLERRQVFTGNARKGRHFRMGQMRFKNLLIAMIFTGSIAHAQVFNCTTEDSTAQPRQFVLQWQKVSLVAQFRWQNQDLTLRMKPMSGNEFMGSYDKWLMFLQQHPDGSSRFSIMDTDSVTDVYHQTLNCTTSVSYKIP